MPLSILSSAPSSHSAKQGTRSRCFEKSHFVVEVGAALLLSSNGIRVLERLGFFFERAPGRRIVAWDILDRTTLENIVSLNLEDAEVRYGVPLMSIHRVNLHNELMGLATSDGGDEGPQVKLWLKLRVVGASAEDGTVVLRNGKVENGRHWVLFQRWKEEVA